MILNERMLTQKVKNEFHGQCLEVTGRSQTESGQHFRFQSIQIRRIVQKFFRSSQNDFKR
jgi:stress-induced morphogen